MVTGNCRVSKACTALRGKKEEGSSRLHRRLGIAAVGPEQCAACEEAEILAGFSCCSLKSGLSSSSLVHGNQSGRYKCHKTAHVPQAVAAAICLASAVSTKKTA